MLDRKLEEMGDCGEEDTTAVTEAATDNRMAVESAQPSPEVLQKEKLIRLLKKEVLPDVRSRLCVIFSFNCKTTTCLRSLKPGISLKTVCLNFACIA